MRRSGFASPRRRGSPVRAVLLVVLVLIVGFAAWLATLDTEVPTERIEQDVTNEVLAS